MVEISYQMHQECSNKHVSAEPLGWLIVCVDTFFVINGFRKRRDDWEGNLAGHAATDDEGGLTGPVCRSAIHLAKHNLELNAKSDSTRYEWTVCMQCNRSVRRSCCCYQQDWTGTQGL